MPIWNLVWRARGCLIFTESSQSWGNIAPAGAPCPGSCDTGPDMQVDVTIRRLHTRHLPRLDRPSGWPTPAPLTLRHGRWEPRAPWHSHDGQGEEVSGGRRGDLAEGTHLPGTLGPGALAGALAGEHGSHLKAACSPPLPTCWGPTLSKTCLL